MDSGNLYEKSPEAQRLLRRIPARLRAVAVVLFVGLSAGTFFLVNWIAFPESVQTDTYLQYEGVHNGVTVFTRSDPAPDAWLRQARQTHFRVYGPGGAVWSFSGKTVFRAPDSVLIDGLKNTPPQTLNRWPLRAALEIELDTLPLWKKVVGYKRRERPG